MITVAVFCALFLVWLILPFLLESTRALRKIEEYKREAEAYMEKRRRMLENRRNRY